MNVKNCTNVSALFAKSEDEEIKGVIKCCILETMKVLLNAIETHNQRSFQKISYDTIENETVCGL
jgi:hypothetical protein